ncbi:MAG TPA: histidinol dehydrogenase [Acetobacteraceae bacterium]|nr:histidinol dehydrogenase [Acetobacteraceae bacterium]
MAERLVTAEPGFEAAFAALLEASRGEALSVEAAVAAIIASVRAEGDAALSALTLRFEQVSLAPSELRISPPDLLAAAAEVPESENAALRLAASRIEAFHRRQLPPDLAFTDEAGVRMGLRWRPLDAVGIYVPGGKAAYPSTVLMNAIPARVAGVSRIVMCVPCPGGRIPPLVAAAARFAGATEVFRVGGAQAIAALAHGTEAIAPVDRIVGPGNAYVAEAKRQVFGRVGIDSIAGPSEVVILADPANDPRLVAIDLLAQAEHDEAAQAILITDSSPFADAVENAVAEALETLPRANIAGASWRTHGAVIVVRDWEEAAALVNRLAPEHVELMLPEPERVFARIRHAGAVFLGRFTPEALGDYVAGPNHVLPTSRTARFSSGLSVLDFLKRTSFVAADHAALARIGPAAVTLAEAEGLSAHARSVSLRLA